MIFFLGIWTMSFLMYGCFTDIFVAIEWKNCGCYCFHFSRDYILQSCTTIYTCIRLELHCSQTSWLLLCSFSIGLYFEYMHKHVYTCRMDLHRILCSLLALFGLYILPLYSIKWVLPSCISALLCEWGLGPFPKKRPRTLVNGSSSTSMVHFVGAQLKDFWR